MERYSIYKLNILISDIINIFERNRNIDDASFLKKVSLNALRNIQDIALKLKLLEIVEESMDIESYLENSNSYELISKAYESFIKCNLIIQKIIFRKNTIIIHSDNPEQFDQFTKRILEENYFVRVTDNKILEGPAHSFPELIILNIRDEEACITTLKTLQQEEIIKSIPVLVIGEDRKDFRLTVFSKGAVGFIPSPFNTDELYLIVSNLLKLLKRDQEDNEISNASYNKKYGKIIATNLIKLCNIKNNSFALTIINLDNMSDINLEIGEKLGNQLVNDMLDIISGTLREEDFLFRNDVDEFCIVFIDRSTKEVEEISHKILTKVEALSDVYNTNFSIYGGISYLSNDRKDFNKIFMETISNLNKAKFSESGTIVSINNISKTLSKRLLIIDNDSVILSILSERYQGKGYSVSTFENPQEALTALKRKEFNLVITNFYMETMSGDMLLRSIKEINNDIKIIVLSGQKSEDIIKRALDCGADDYLKKPFSLIELDSRIERFFR